MICIPGQRNYQEIKCNNGLSKIKYVAMLWLSSLKKHTRKLERMQRAATKIILSLSDKTYEEQRMGREHLIEHKLMEGLEKLDCNKTE